MTSPSVTRVLRMCACVLCVATASVAQVVFTLEDLDKAMKEVGRNVALAERAIASADFGAAKVRVARARERLSPTLSFWQNEKRTDAQQMVRAATSKLDDLDARLSASPVDASRVAAAAAELQAACQNCHAAYREQDPATQTFRPILQRKSDTKAKDAR